jgi:hypothetical protein
VASVELVPTKSFLDADLDTLGPGERADPEPLPVGISLAPSITGAGELARSDVRGLIGGDFRWNHQRSMWWNSRVERWDAIIPTASPPATEVSAWWLWTDVVGAATAPNLELSTRPSSPDVYWDDTSCELSVFFSRDAAGTSRFQRFVYDPHEDRYLAALDVDGVPVDLRGSRRVTIVRTPNGYLWAGVNHDLAVRITRSMDGGMTWATPVTIRNTIANGDNHWTVFTEHNSVRVGLAIGEDVAHTRPEGPAPRAHDRPAPRATKIDGDTNDVARGEVSIFVRLVDEALDSRCSRRDARADHRELARGVIPVDVR